MQNHKYHPSTHKIHAEDCFTIILARVRAEINVCNAKDTIQSSRKISSQTDCLIAVLYNSQ